MDVPGSGKYLDLLDAHEQCMAALQTLLDNDYQPPIAENLQQTPPRAIRRRRSVGDLHKNSEANLALGNSAVRTAHFRNSGADCNDGIGGHVPEGVASRAGERGRQEVAHEAWRALKPALAELLFLGSPAIVASSSAELSAKVERLQALAACSWMTHDCPHHVMEGQQQGPSRAAEQMPAAGRAALEVDVEGGSIEGSLGLFW
jgi:hypothetical protein